MSKDSSCPKIHRPRLAIFYCYNSYTQKISIVINSAKPQGIEISTESFHKRHSRNGSISGLSSASVWIRRHQNLIYSDQRESVPNFFVHCRAGARSKFWEVSGVGVTTVSNSLMLGGWVTKALKNGDEK